MADNEKEENPSSSEENPLDALIFQTSNEALDGILRAHQDALGAVAAAQNSAHEAMQHALQVTSQAIMGSPVDLSIKDTAPSQPSASNHEKDEAAAAAGGQPDPGSQAPTP